jgi:hypothetical protein
MAMKLFTLYGASGNTLMTEMVIPIAAANRSVARTSAVTPCPWSWISHLGNAGRGKNETSQQTQEAWPLLSKKNDEPSIRKDEVDSRSRKVQLLGQPQ